MSTHSIQSLGNTFAITIAFALGTPLLILVMILAGNVSGSFSGQAGGVTDWYQVGATVVACAGFAGLLVDASRFMAGRFWP